MSTDFSHTADGSAKIYQFPPRGRFAVRVASHEATTAPGFASPGIAKIVFGSSWYHEEAVQEERSR
jgi:hypothetical protein